MPAAHVSLAVSADLLAIVRPAALAIDDVVVREREAALDAAMTQAARQARMSAERTDVNAAVRSMYRRVGIDPTKTRPSSEALARRVRKGGDLPRINTAVDVVNWCSLESELPFGLYDHDAIVGEVVLRLGGPGEQYAGIRKDAVHVEGRLTLADAAGPFGNPTSDSARTMVSPGATRLLVVIFAPADLPVAHVQRALALTAERMTEFCVLCP